MGAANKQSAEGLPVTPLDAPQPAGLRICDACGHVESKHFNDKRVGCAERVGGCLPHCPGRYCSCRGFKPLPLLGITDVDTATDVTAYVTPPPTTPDHTP